MEYEIVATEAEREAFKRVAKAKMAMHGMKTSDIARETAYSEQTIRYFFSKGKWSRFLSAYMADRLSIREEEWK